LASYLWCAGFITSDLLSKLHFFSVPPFFYRLGHIPSFTCGPYATFHGMAWKWHIEGSIITAVWKNLRMFLTSKIPITMIKCRILLKQVLDGNLHIPFQSMNRLNQPELEIFSILFCWAFLGIIYLSLFEIYHSIIIF
jgi:hypothetical protein